MQPDHQFPLRLVVIEYGGYAECSVVLHDTIEHTVSDLCLLQYTALQFVVFREVLTLMYIKRLYTTSTCTKYILQSTNITGYDTQLT